MTLLRADDVSLELGDQVIFREAAFHLEEGERVCLIGRNGAGKTTLFRLISGDLQADSGDFHFRQNLVVSQLEQVLPPAMKTGVAEYVSDGLHDARALVERFEQLSREPDSNQRDRELEELQRRIDASDGWRLEQRVDEILSDMQLPGSKSMDQLSGGWRRRVALARALVSKPDLLLLDEPTNHLDISTISWLENQIFGWQGSVLFITHDRAFLQNLATRILELDRGKLTSWPGSYRNYQRRKAEAVEAEQREQQLFDKKLANEEAWIRQGIKARRTRNEGRVRALEAMREEAAGRIKQTGKAYISIDEAEQSGRKVIRARNVSYSYGEEKVIDSLTLTVMRGDRIGLVGNNGVGKSTLLRLLLGDLQAETGTLKLGTNLEVGYFDQLRQDLDPDKSVAENVGDGKDYITVNGKQRHVIGYLKGFLFPPKRAMTPVRALSGGERNRVVLARLFTRPSNLLVLDEPTNDLDVETLEVLEQRLIDYRGTLIVVSHDREFLDNVVTSILVFEDDGDVHQYVGGFSDWERRGRELAVTDDPDKTARKPKATGDGKQARPAKLSYKQQRELDELPGRIEELEKSISDTEAEIADPDFYSRGHDATAPVITRLEAARHDLENAVERWAELEELRETYERYRS